MDDFLFYIVIFVIWLLFQVLGGKKKKKKRPVQGTSTPLPGIPGTPGRPTAKTPGAEPTLEDALREIRQALGMEKPSQPAPPPPRASPPPLPKPRPSSLTPKKTHSSRSHGPELAETAPKKSWSNEFHAYPTHYADSDFEEFAGEGDRFGKRRTKQKAQTAPKSTTAKLRPLKPIKPVETSVSRSKVLTQLNNPTAAREAFILSEILGPPRVNKRR